MSKKTKLVKVKKKVGRPERIQEEELKKLREAFAFGCTDMEAIQYTNMALGYYGKNPITERTFYDYQDRHPEFAQEKEALKSNPVMQAQKNIIDVLTATKSFDKDGNEVPLTFTELQSKLETSKWYLGRKKKAEFGQKLIEINNNDNRSLTVVKDNPKVFKTLMKAYGAMVENAKKLTADEQKTS